MPIFATNDRAKLVSKSTCALYTDLDLSLKLYQNPKEFNNVIILALLWLLWSNNKRYYIYIKNIFRSFRGNFQCDNHTIFDDHFFRWKLDRSQN